MPTAVVIYPDRVEEVPLENRDELLQDILGEHRSVVTIRLGDQLGTAVINDFGRQMDLPVNPLASELYGYEESVVGPMVVEGFLLPNGDDEPLLPQHISYIKQLSAPST